MARENKNLLDEIYKATKMRLEATQLVIPKVHDKSLRDQIEQQCKGYRGMNLKAKAMLREDGRLPEEEDSIKKVMLWGNLKINTLVNKKPDHIAEVMINSTATGIADMTKRLNELDDSDAGAKRLAEDYIVNEQKNIENLEKHL